MDNFLKLYATYDEGYEPQRCHQWLIEMGMQHSTPPDVTRLMKEAFVIAPSHVNKNDVRELAWKREPVNIAMERYYKQELLDKHFKYKKGAYEGADESPNIAVFTRTPFWGEKNKQYEVDVIHLIGAALDSKDQPDYRVFYPSGELDVPKLQQFYREMYTMMFEAALIVQKRRKRTMELQMVGLVGAVSFWAIPKKQYSYDELITIPVLYPLMEKYKSKLKSTILQYIPNYKPGKNTFQDMQHGNASQTELDNIILTNAWDCWTMPGNGNDWDHSLDGYWGRASCIAFLGWPKSNPHMTYRYVDVGGKSSTTSSSHAIHVNPYDESGTLLRKRPKVDMESNIAGIGSVPNHEHVTVIDGPESDGPGNEFTKVRYTYEDDLNKKRSMSGWVRTKYLTMTTAQVPAKPLPSVGTGPCGVKPTTKSPKKTTATFRPVHEDVLRNTVSINGHGTYSHDLVTVPKGVQVLVPHNNGLQQKYTLHASKEYSNEEFLYGFGYLNYGRGWHLYKEGDKINNMVFTYLEHTATCEKLSEFPIQKSLDKTISAKGNMRLLYATAGPQNGFELAQYNKKHKLKLKICKTETLENVMRQIHKMIARIPASSRSKVEPVESDTVVFIPFTCNATASTDLKLYISKTDKTPLRTVYASLTSSSAKPSTQSPAKKLAVQKPATAAKKPATKQPATAAKKPATKQPATKQPATKQPATAAKKPATKQPAAKKPATAANKSAANKSAANKSAAKKPAAKKPASKKPAAKKPASKKPVAKKPVAKKPAAKFKPTAIVYNKYAEGQGTLLRKRDSEDNDWVTHNNQSIEVMNDEKVELLENIDDALKRGGMCHVKYKKHKGYIRCKYLRPM